MTNKNIFIGLIFAFVISMPFNAWAYLIEPTTYNNYCVKIENFNDFPEYKFILLLWPNIEKNGAALYIMEENKCQTVEPGFDGTRRLYAINKKDETILNNISAQDFNRSNGTPPSPQILPFQYSREIGAWGNPDEKYNNIESIIKIDWIGEKEGKLTRTNINIKEDGKTEKIFEDKTGTVSSFIFNIIILSAIGIVIIITGVVVKKSKKGVLKK